MLKELTLYYYYVTTPYLQLYLNNKYINYDLSYDGILTVKLWNEYFKIFYYKRVSHSRIWIEPKIFNKNTFLN